MAKVKGSNQPKKDMSEGTAIALIILAVTIGGIGVYYLVRWFVNIFLPDLF